MRIVLCSGTDHRTVCSRPAKRRKADTFTYYITSIPNATSVVYADNLNNSLTDTLSGTITLSSTQSVLGTWSSTDVTQIEAPNAPITLTYNLSMSNSSVSNDNITGSQDLATLINNGDIQGGGLTVTSSGLFMPIPTYRAGKSFSKTPPWNLRLTRWYR